MKLKKYLHSFFIIILLLQACSGNERTAHHVYVQNTNVFIHPQMMPFEKSYSFYGIKDPNKKWSVSITEEEQSLKELKNIYRHNNLLGTQKDLLDKDNVRINGYKGFYVKFMDRRYRRVRQHLILDLGDKRLALKAWVRKYYAEEYEDKLKEVLYSVYFASPTEVKLAKQKREDKY